MLDITLPGKLLQQGGSTGGSGTVTVPATMINPVPVVYNYGVGAPQGDTTFGALTVNYSGAGFTDEEKRVARNAVGSIANPVTNEQYITHVTRATQPAGSTTPTTTIMVFTGVFTHNALLNIEKIGTPTSTLPDGAALTAIETRLNNNNISLLNFGASELKIAKMALNLLSDNELARLRDVRYQRAGAGGERIGGRYQQSSHTVEIYDTGVSNAALMALGHAAGSMFPVRAHAVLHEAAHVLAYWEIRRAELRDQQAKRDLDAARDTMRTRWGAYYTETIGDGGTWSYTVQPESNVQPASDRPQYRADLQTLRQRMTAADTANRAYTGITQSQIMARFVHDCGTQPAMTEYSRDERAHANGLSATDPDRAAAIRSAHEEVMAESFAIWKWNPDWLLANRSSIKTYFDSNRHLLP